MILIPGEAPGTSSSPGRAEPDSIQLAGHFLLRPADAYGITVVLAGTPAPGSPPPVRLDAALPGGKVAACL